MAAQGRASATVEQPAQGPAEDASRQDEILSDDTMPAIIELLVLEDEESAESARQQNSSSSQADQAVNRPSNSSSPSLSHGHQHSRQPSAGKVMTAKQFEMYRRALDMRHSRTGSVDQDSEDDYDDKDDDEDEYQKSLAVSRERQRQSAYLKAQRLERSKVSGGEDVKKAPEIATPVAALFENWDDGSKGLGARAGAHSSGSSSNGNRQDDKNDDDDDVPLGLLIRSHTPQFPDISVTKQRGHKDQQQQQQPRPQHYRHHSHSGHHFVERPQTRLSSHHAPAPPRQALPIARAQTPQSQQYLSPNQGAPRHHMRGASVGSNMTMGSSGGGGGMGAGMSMGNASLLSLSAPQPRHQPQSVHQHRSQYHGQRSVSSNAGMSMGNASLLSLGPQHHQPQYQHQPQHQAQPQYQNQPGMGVGMSIGNASLFSLAPQQHLQHQPLYQNQPGMGAGMGMGMGMSMGNDSLVSLAPQQPQYYHQHQYQRPHTSGGLIAAIDQLGSPSPYNNSRVMGPPKDFLGIPVNPPKFYGRWT